MKLYSGIDLHSSNNFLAIIDEDGKPIMKTKLVNDPQLILDTLSPYKTDTVGVVVESTYNWYWLVDALMAEGYQTHLANPSAMQKYSGLKHVDDKTDALWLAEMLRLNVLPKGYIYPKEQRPLRDLLRKRQHLVRLRTSLIISLQNIITRNSGLTIKSDQIKNTSKDYISPLLPGNEFLSMSVTTSKAAIDNLSKQIALIESAVEKQLKTESIYNTLLTIPGIGKILALTVTLETGPIARFPQVGNYSSYCRKVESKWTSNNKNKGKGNRKNGNKYLAWAFSEAAERARQSNEACRSFYNRKLKKTNRMIAHNALAHKLARAAYYVMRDNTCFDESKLMPENPGWSGKPLAKLA